jgi:1-acyl-sn-glycerol-3-phosphate acyltransferase
VQATRSVVFTTLMFISVALYSPFVVAGRLFGKPAAYAVAREWSRCVMWMCKTICGIDYTVEGRENIPSQTGVVLMNHASALETIAQFDLFPRQCWVLKRELMWVPFLGWALAALHSIAINRNAGRTAVRQVIDQGKARLDEGLWVIIFPEGTRMRPGETRRYGVSGTLLAEEAGRLIVPVAHNAGDFWPRRGLRKKPGTVRFCIGPPINPAGRDPREVTTEIQTWIENKVAEIRNGEPAEPKN